ncbi:MAG: hypothetical protein ACKO85_21700 [Isosphaeraceae bacterium]
MNGHFADPMFRLLYPPNWKVEESGDELDRMVEIEAPGGLAWMTLSIHSDRSAQDLLQEALGAMKGEYDGLAEQAIEAAIDGQPAQGYDLDFISLDFPISGLLRAIETPDGGMLIQGQWSNVDIGDSQVSYADVVVAMLTSLELSFTYEEE